MHQREGAFAEYVVSRRELVSRPKGSASAQSRAGELWLAVGTRFRSERPHSACPGLARCMSLAAARLGWAATCLRALGANQITVAERTLVRLR